MCRISVIMPVYNAEKYLEEAINSVLNQTFKDIELICINDASTDSSLEILHKLQKKDLRIKIITNNTRLGAGDSRNKGIKESLGEYVIFLDADDIFESEMLQVAYMTMEKHDAEIIIYEYMHVNSENIYEKRYVYHNEDFKKRFCDHVFSIKECRPIELLKWNMSPWNKMFKKSFIVSNTLEFQTLSSANDVYFVEMSLLMATRIIFLDDNRVMVYARDHFEPSRISFDRDPMCIYYAMEKLGKELLKRNKFKELYNYYYVVLFYVLRSGLLKAKKRETAVKFYNFIKEEGLDSLINIDLELYKKTDGYLIELFNKYKELDFLSQWYLYENVFAYYLNKKSKEIIFMIKNYLQEDKKIVLWGIGERGIVFLNFLNKYQLHISEVVDKDIKKQGNTILNYEIKNPEMILKNAQIVITTSDTVYEEICTQINKKDIEVINLEKLLEVY